MKDRLGERWGPCDGDGLWHWYEGLEGEERTEVVETEKEDSRGRRVL